MSWKNIDCLEILILLISRSLEIPRLLHSRSQGSIYFRPLPVFCIAYLEFRDGEICFDTNLFPFIKLVRQFEKYSSSALCCESEFFKVSPLKINKKCFICFLMFQRTLSISKILSLYFVCITSLKNQITSKLCVQSFVF